MTLAGAEGARCQVRNSFANPRVASIVRLALLALLLAGCPKKQPPPPPAVTEADAGEITDASSQSAELADVFEEPFDAWVPERPSIVLKPDWENRYDNGPKFVYETLGLPALSPDGQRIVVSGTEIDRTADPSFKLITLLADDREESSTVLQTTREYREALYPSTVDYPTPEVTDPIFRTLIKTVNKRLSDASATLAHHTPLPPCRLEPKDDAGIRLHATCVGLSVTYEQHHLHVIGRGGHVRLDRSVAAWKDTVPIPGAVGWHDEVKGIYGDAAHSVLVFKISTVAQRYYGNLSPKWHVVKLGP